MRRGAPKAHQTGSGKGLAYLDEATTQWVVPFVVEPSAGVDRCFLTVLVDAYEEETKANGETSVVLHLHPKLAPTQVGVYPLVKKDGMPERARSRPPQASGVQPTRTEFPASRPALSRDPRATFLARYSPHGEDSGDGSRRFDSD